MANIIRTAVTGLLLMTGFADVNISEAVRITERDETVVVTATSTVVVSTESTAAPSPAPAPAPSTMVTTIIQQPPPATVTVTELTTLITTAVAAVPLPPFLSAPPLVTVTEQTTVTALTTAPTEPEHIPGEPTSWRRPMKCVWTDDIFRVFVITVDNFFQAGIADFCRGFWDNLHYRSCSVGAGFKQCHALNDTANAFKLEAISTTFCDPAQVERAFFRASYGGQYGNLTCKHCHRPYEGDCTLLRGRIS